MEKERIAIIGMGCRFPGKLNDVESYWKFLLEGKDAVVEVPKDRWNIERFYDAEPGLARALSRTGRPRVGPSNGPRTRGTGR